MSAPGQSGNGGQGQGGVGGNPGSPDQPTSTTSELSAATSISPSTSSTESSPSTTSTATDTAAATSGVSSGNSQKTAIIGGVVGGVAGLLILSLLGILFLQRRKKRKNAPKHGMATPVTYASLNSAFAGVPFAHSPGASPHHSLLPLTTTSSTSYPAMAMRGGETTPGQRSSGNETDRFLPSYAESQSATSPRGHSSLAQINTSHNLGPGTPNISPLSATEYHEAHHVSPQTTGGSGILSPVPHPERDTMGFPIDPSDFQTIDLQPPPIPIMAPVPRHPLIHQDSLERVVRDGLTPSDSPAPGLAVNPERLRVISQEMPRESPILGLGGQPRVYTKPPPVFTRWDDGPGRNDSQRTVSTVSSIGPSIISDGELERLGVGSQHRQI